MLYQDTLTGTLHEVPDSQVRLGIWRRTRMAWAKWFTTDWDTH